MPNFATRAVACALAVLPAAQVQADSCWWYGDSLMRLQAFGQARVIQYEIPSEEAQYQDAIRGMIVFEGVNVDGAFSGAFSLPSEVCHRPIHVVTGAVSEDPLTITLSGERLRRDGCNITPEIETVSYVFTFASDC